MTNPLRSLDDLSPRRATAILLAGGRSGRMGRDKALLPIRGRPLLQYIYEQLEPSFDEVLVSASDAAAYAFLGTRVVPDRVPGQGPLMGIASCLAASRNDLNFVVACDMPVIDLPRVRRMLAEAEGYDAVVPRDARGNWEPLFAVYRRSMLSAADEVLIRGCRRIIEMYPGLRIRVAAEGPDRALVNINEEADYERFRRGEREE